MQDTSYGIPFLIAVFTVGIPMAYFYWKDKTVQDGVYPLTRIEYALWVLFVFSSIWVYSLVEGHNFGSRYVSNRENIVCWGMFISLTYILSRRMADLGWKRSYCVIGIINGLWIILFFWRGKQRIAPATANSTFPGIPPLSIMLFQNNQSYGPYELADVLTMWDSGQVAGNAMYWHEGIITYSPLASDIVKLRTMHRI